jgi:hypothetical protein
MFKAVLFVCFMATPDKCFNAVDVRGPYEDMRQCRNRVFEMKTDITTNPKTKKLLFVVSTRCDKVKEERHHAQSQGV